jgi:hypothetical protein
MPTFSRIRNLFQPAACVNLRGILAGIAQLVEQLICNQQVVGSNPTAGSVDFRFPTPKFFACSRPDVGVADFRLRVPEPTLERFDCELRS